VAGEEMDMKKHASFSGALIAMATVGLLGALASAQGQADADQLLQRARTKAVVEGKLDEAVKLYADIAARFKSDRPTVARAIIEMADCYEKLGHARARELYEQVVRDYGDQADEVIQARARLAVLTSTAAGAARPAGPVMRRLSNNPEFSGRPSADGRFFSRTDWKSGEVLIDELATGSTRRLPKASSKDGSAALPIISPDNKLVAYWQSADPDVELRVVPFDGSAPPRVVCRRTGLTGYASVNWMPDGKALLSVGWRRSSGGSVAEIVNLADGRGRVVKTTDTDLPQDPVISPDGRYVAYDLPSQKGNRDVFVLAVADLSEWPAVAHPARDEMVGWTSDGGQLLFISDRSGTDDLWSLPVVNGKPAEAPIQIKKDIGRVLESHLSRSGSLYYSVRTGGPDVYLGQLDAGAGKLVGGPEHVADHLTEGHTSPDFSLNGRYLSFVRRGAQGGNTLLVRDLKTGAEAKVPTKATLLFNPRLAPDGGSVIVGGGGQPGEPGYYRVDVQTGEQTLVLKTRPGLNGFNNVGWMPDGRSIFFLRHSDERPLVRVLTRRDLATGADKELARVNEPYYVGDCQASPDGRWIAFVRLDSSKPMTTELWIVPAAGGDARTVSSFDGMLRALAWSPDSRQVLFVGTPRETENNSGLWRTAIDTGTTARIEGFNRPVRQFGQFRVHPDGRRIAFAAGEPQAEFWVLENFLPKSSR
jgi:Tol biopolymer transport system component